jgi:Leucine-rich repeat (LRR) protein
MKTLLLSIILLFTINSYAQIVNIPDANFKSYLVGNTAINTNADNQIQVSEASTFNGGIYCQWRNISNVTGIEAFTALTTLYLYQNQLSTVDLSQNAALTQLRLDNNFLTSLDVSQNTALTWLQLSNNQVTSLDLTQNLILDDLFCDFNQLACLNVKNGNNVNFNWFHISNNPNLSCVEVDDVAWSTSNWTVVGGEIDSQMYFSTDCGSSCTAGVLELNNSPKQLLKIVDLMGRETPFKPNTVLIYVYDDGTTERVLKVD